MNDEYLLRLHLNNDYIVFENVLLMNGQDLQINWVFCLINLALKPRFIGTRKVEIGRKKALKQVKIGNKNRHPKLK